MSSARWCLFLFLSGFFLLSEGRTQSVFALSDVKPHVVQVHRAREAGVVESVEVKIGDKVEEGQLLVRLEHVRQLHAYLTAKARAENSGGLMIAEGELQEKSAALEEMNNRYKRRQVSASQVAQSQGQLKAAEGKLEQARMNAKLAELELKLAENMLERRFVRCTFKGTVIEISKNPDERANEGDAVVTVADLNWMTALIPLTRESAAALAANATFPVRIAGSSIIRAAQVLAVTPMPNATKGEQLVQIAFANGDPLSPIKDKTFEVLLPEGVKPVPPAPKPPPAKKTPGRT